MLDLLGTLCGLDAVSGREDAVRDWIMESIGAHAQCRVDALGNVIAFKKGAQPAKNKVMLCAHMDEVGLIVTYITEEGYLKCSAVGGIDPRVLFGRRVLVGASRLPGVIGAKPVHLLKEEERGAAPQLDEMLVDIGAKSREEAEQAVRPGDIAVFDSEFISFGDGCLKGKAIDDRAGCAVLLDMICRELPYDLWFSFHVQEEIGTRGAQAAAYSIAPDYALVLEATTAADISGVEGEKRVCALGAGAVVSYMDRSTIYDRGLYELAFSLAEQNKIAIQTKSVVAGGNDAGAIHKSRGGVRTLSVSVPCRYLHSACCVIKENDLEQVRRLAEVLSVELAQC